MSKISSMLRASLEAPTPVSLGPVVGESSIDQTTLEGEFAQINKEINKVIELSNNLKALKDSIASNIEEGDIDNPLVKLQTTILNRINKMVGGDTLELPSMESYIELQAQVYNISLEADKSSDSAWSKFVAMLKRWWEAFVNLFRKNEKDLDKVASDTKDTIQKAKFVMEVDLEAKEREKIKKITASIDGATQQNKRLVKEYQVAIDHIKHIESMLKHDAPIMESDKKFLFQQLAKFGELERDVKRFDEFMDKGETLDDFKKTMDDNITYNKIIGVVNNVKITPLKKLIPNGDKPISENKELAKFKHQLDSRYAASINRLIKYKSDRLSTLKKVVEEANDRIEKAHKGTK